MKIIKWECGCIQIEGENIFLSFCEGDKGDDYGFFYDTRICNPPFQEIIGSEKENILAVLQNHTHNSYLYYNLRQVIRALVS